MLVGFAFFFFGMSEVGIALSVPDGLGRARRLFGVGAGRGFFLPTVGPISLSFLFFPFFLSNMLHAHIRLEHRMKRALLIFGRITYSRAEGRMMSRGMGD